MPPPVIAINTHPGYLFILVTTNSWLEKSLSRWMKNKKKGFYIRWHDSETLIFFFIRVLGLAVCLFSLYDTLCLSRRAFNVVSREPICTHVSTHIFLFQIKIVVLGEAQSCPSFTKNLIHTNNWVSPLPLLSRPAMPLKTLFFF